MSVSFADLWNIARDPIAPETRRNLRAIWAKLPEFLKTTHQMYGRHAEGCGATIGAMPRCDFACTGCYLGEEANKIPALPVEAIKKQMRQMRPKLGVRGNLQLTDGEVTLRPVEEQIELLRYANEIGLIPMLMTHGDTFRRQPGLLERLVLEGGLMEVSIHVDTTQRGRKGAEWRDPKDEAALNPLRDEFAAMIRECRRTTGRKITAATTMTISPENLGGVPDVMEWLVRNADVFKMISFQPMAQVGRTEEGLGGGVTVEALWEKINDGLYGAGENVQRLLDGAMWLGHSACNRYVPGFVVRDDATSDPRFVPARQVNDPADVRVNLLMWDRLGGISFRNDSTWTAFARFLGVVYSSIDLFATHGLSHIESILRRVTPKDGNPLAFLARLAAKRSRVNGLLVVSHHFMSNWEIATPLGQERIENCVFTVPIGDRMVSMCEVNTTGIRDAYYEDITAGREPGLTPLKVRGNPALPVVQSPVPLVAHGH